jgi:predicted Ser/Thr protein kinase
MSSDQNTKTFFDIPKLSLYIKELVKKYDSSAVVEEPKKNIFLQNILYIIESCIAMNFINNKNYWIKNGFRIEEDDKIKDCIDSIEKKSKVHGKGVHGIVYDVRKPFCLKNIPKNIKKVAVKIESINPSYLKINDLKNSIEISKYAAKINIAPKLYDVFVIFNKEKNIKIVKIYEFIEGVTFREKKWKSSLDKKNILKELEKKIQKMNEAGIIHKDLHSGNILITKDNKIYLIDFDRAKYTKNAEKHMIQFINYNNTSYNNNSDIPKKLVDYVYHHLIENKLLII